MPVVPLTIQQPLAHAATSADSSSSRAVTWTRTPGISAASTKRRPPSLERSFTAGSPPVDEYRPLMIRKSICVLLSAAAWDFFGSTELAASDFPSAFHDRSG